MKPTREVPPDPCLKNADLVNHPTHYNSHPSGVECIDVVEHMTFNAGNVVKYCWRAGLKAGSSATPCESSEEKMAARLQDLKKARWYLNREIERLEKEDA